MLLKLGWQKCHHLVTLHDFARFKSSLVATLGSISCRRGGCCRADTTRRIWSEWGVCCKMKGGLEICFCSVFGCLGYCPILYLIYQRSLGGGFKHFVFLPLLVVNDPIWRAYISIGLKQPSTVGLCFLTLEIDNSVIFCMRCGVSQVSFGRSRFLDVYRLIPWNDSHWISRVPNWSCYRLPLFKTTSWQTYIFRWQISYYSKNGQKKVISQKHRDVPWLYVPENQYGFLYDAENGEGVPSWVFSAPLAAIPSVTRIHYISSHSASEDDQEIQERVVTFDLGPAIHLS